MPLWAHLRQLSFGNCFFLCGRVVATAFLFSVQNEDADYLADSRHRLFDCYSVVYLTLMGIVPQKKSLRAIAFVPVEPDEDMTIGCVMVLLV